MIQTLPSRGVETAIIEAELQLVRTDDPGKRIYEVELLLDVVVQRALAHAGDGRLTVAEAVWGTGREESGHGRRNAAIKAGKDGNGCAGGSAPVGVDMAR